MSLEDYPSYLQSPEWKTRCVLALEHAEYHCQICNNPDELRVHHRTYKNVGQELPRDLTVLCSECHSIFHEQFPHSSGVDTQRNFGISAARFAEALQELADDEERLLRFVGDNPGFHREWLPRSNRLTADRLLRNDGSIEQRSCSRQGSRGHTHYELFITAKGLERLASVPGFSVNLVEITGNLTSDPELRTVGSGTELCKLRIAAIQGRRKNAVDEWEDQVGFFSVTLWGGFGAYHARNLAKGDQVLIVGKLSWHEWETEDGHKREAVEIVVNSNEGSCIPIPRRDGANNRDNSAAVSQSDIPDAGPDDFVHTAAQPVAASSSRPPGDDDKIPF